MNHSNQLYKLSESLKSNGFLAEADSVNTVVQKVLLRSLATDFANYVTDPAIYPATSASDEVAELLGQGAALVNNHHGAENYMAFTLPNFIERLDWLSRKYKDQITETDKASLGQLERDLHEISKKINAQTPI